jgi:hypothetical protein
VGSINSPRSFAFNVFTACCCIVFLLVRNQAHLVAAPLALCSIPRPAECALLALLLESALE